ncbi:hypothetical protein [Lacipirellula sp.]|uniref:hypothetical protein n=1 Tax=Lacipirellula sp. TaxID=2691419 RepID=UPI003D0A5AB8
MKYRLVFIAFLIAVLTSHSGIYAGAPSELRKHWDKWDAVRTLELDGFTIYLPFALSDSKFSREELRKFIHSELTEAIALQTKEVGLDRLNALTSKLTAGTLRLPSGNGITPPAALATKPLASWRAYAFIADGDLARTDAVIDGKLTTAVRSPDGEVRYEESLNQASLYASKSMFRVEAKRDFLFYPLVGDEAESVSVSPNDAGRVRLTTPVMSAEIEESTGFVHYFERHPDGGKPRFELYQLAPTVLDTGAVVPRLIAETTYSRNSDQAASMRIYLFNSINANREIAAEQFKVSAPQQTRVVNFSQEVTRGDGKQPVPSVEIAKEPVADVKTYASTTDFGLQQSALGSELSESRFPSLRVSLLVVNGVVIFCLVLWMLRRRGA